MIILGLTGSVGMGKSTTAALLRDMGIPVHESDVTVHNLLGPGGAAVDKVAALFPEAKTLSGTIDRAVLGNLVFQDLNALKRLESILHPMVQEEENKFIARCQAEGHGLVVLDIPLLFETGAHKKVSAVAVVSAPTWMQKRRVLKRPGMTERRFHQILARQMPHAEKCRRADFIIPTGWGTLVTRFALKRMIKVLKKKPLHITKDQNPFLLTLFLVFYDLVSLYLEGHFP